MDIKVVGAGCDKCDRLYENVLEAVKLTHVDATVTKVEDLIETVKLGVMTAPTLMIDGRQVIKGTVASVQDICRQIKKLK